MDAIITILYITDSGKTPFIDWLNGLDTGVRLVIKKRLDRIRMGNLGDCKALQDTGGIYELRIDFGAGYRIYFGKKHNSLIILLTGGSKKTQKKDIIKAKEYWQTFRTQI